MHLQKFKNYAMPVLFFYFCSMIQVNSLQCYRCGTYNEGVGSVTNCFNYTDEKHLKECSDENAQCVKYVMDASTVRDCSTNCDEKDEKEGTQIYCCNENACNFTRTTSSSILVIFLPIVVILLSQNRQFLLNCNFRDTTNNVNRR